MMLLLFKVKGDRYGIGVNQIVEVMPNVALQRVPRVPNYFSGILNYRGQVLPFLDLSRLVINETSKKCLSTRIVLIRPKSIGERFIGLLAEDVTETAKISESDISRSGIAADCEGFINGVVLHNGKMIRIIDTEKLLSEEVKRFLYHGDVVVESLMQEIKDGI